MLDEASFIEGKVHQRGALCHEADTKHRSAICQLRTNSYSYGVTQLRYLYSNRSVFAVYKPAGTHSVRLPGGKGGESVADLLLAHTPSLAAAGRSQEDAGLVHRLDQSTSGLLLGASDRSVWDTLFEQIASGAIKKEYIVCVEGRFDTLRTITSFIGSPNRGAHKMKSYERDPGPGARALDGTTTFTPVSYDPVSDTSLVQASASPARRHQIRVHAASLGHPLVGDALYGSTRVLGEIAKEPREFLLHSWRISFRHPESGEEVLIESPISDEVR